MALICETGLGEAIFFARILIQEDGRMPRIIWFILIIVIFGAAMFFLRRYMER
jgi:flagellar biosynthesis protein FliQ